jgi:mannosyltransferase
MSTTAMRPSSTDQTAIIVRVMDEPAPDPEAGPKPWTPEPEDLPAEPEPLANPRLTVLAWLIPVLVTGALGAWKLATPGLSEDELATWGMVSIDWSHFESVLRNVDATLAPYYLLMRGWVALVGDTDLLLRLPSVVFAAAAAGFVAGVGIKLGGRRVGLAGGLIFALVPGLSRYAQDARPYALTMFAAALATFVLVKLLDQPRLRLYLAYTLAMMFVGLANVVALLLLLAHGLAVWQIRRSGRAFSAWLAAAVIAVLPTLPLLYLGTRQSGTQITWIPPLTWSRLGDTPAQLFGAEIIAGAVMALALAAMSLRSSMRIITLWAVVPAAGLAAAQFITPLWVPRYLLFVLPAWALLAAMALRRLTVLRGLVAVLGIGALSMPTQVTIRDVGGHEFASRDISSVIKANALPGDAVLFGPFDNGDQRISRDAFDRYLAPAERPQDKLMVLPPRTNGALGAQECADAQIPACFGKPGRVWVVRTGKLTDALDGIGPAKQQLLRLSFVQSEIWPLKGFTVALYTRKPAA